MPLAKQKFPASPFSLQPSDLQKKFFQGVKDPEVLLLYRKKWESVKIARLVWIQPIICLCGYYCFSLFYSWCSDLPTMLLSHFIIMWLRVSIPPPLERRNNIHPQVNIPINSVWLFNSLQFVVVGKAHYTQKAKTTVISPQAACITCLFHALLSTHYFSCHHITYKNRFQWSVHFSVYLGSEHIVDAKSLFLMSLVKTC